MNLKTPSIHKFFTAPAYLREFFEMNKSASQEFSYRQFANAIDWPVSYLHDVINGRKKLTVLRAVQFAHYLKFNSIETERLIYFSLSEESDPAVQEYSQKRLTVTTDDEKRMSSVDYEFFENVDVEAVFNVLVWARKRIPNQKIKALLYTHPDLTEKRIAKIVEWLVQKSLLVFDQRGNLQSYTEEVVLDEHGADPQTTGVHIHEKYAQSFAEFTRNAQSPCMYNGGMYELPRKDFLMVAQRILETRNWVAEYAQATRKLRKENIQETLVFQMDMNLFTVFDKTAVQSISDQQKDAQDLGASE